MTDTDQLLATVREALDGHKRVRDNPDGTFEYETPPSMKSALAALDSLAAELEEKDDAIGAYMKQSSEQADESRKWRKRANTAETDLSACRMGRGELEAELERVKAERDEERDAVEDWRRLADEHRDEKLAVEARLDKALSALREIHRDAHGKSQWWAEQTARAALAALDEALS